MIDFPSPLNSLSITDVSLTTSCINEDPFVFANTDPVPSPPVIENRVIPKKVVKDEDYKQRYSSAVAAWVIVLIIVGLATICITYIWCKGKQVMGELASEMIKSETLMN